MLIWTEKITTKYHQQILSGCLKICKVRQGITLFCHTLYLLWQFTKEQWRKCKTATWDRMRREGTMHRGCELSQQSHKPSDPHHHHCLLTHVTIHRPLNGVQPHSWTHKLREPVNSYSHHAASDQPHSPQPTHRIMQQSWNKNTHYN